MSFLDVDGDEVLDLDASHPPKRPRSTNEPVLHLRVPAHLAQHVRRRMEQHGVNMNRYLIGLVERDINGWPDDVREWLVRQAGQCGVPGDPEAALVAVVRHLAARWPNGARLRP